MTFTKGDTFYVVLDNRLGQYLRKNTWEGYTPSLKQAKHWGSVESLKEDIVINDEVSILKLEVLV